MLARLWGFFTNTKEARVQCNDICVSGKKSGDDRESVKSRIEAEVVRYEAMKEKPRANIEELYQKIGRTGNEIGVSVEEGVAELTRDYRIALDRAENKPTAESLLPKAYQDDDELLNLAEQLVNSINETLHLNLEVERLQCVLRHQARYEGKIDVAEGKLQKQLDHLTP